MSKEQKQKLLLEDSTIIHRVKNSLESLVFYIHEEISEEQISKLINHNTKLKENKND